MRFTRLLYTKILIMRELGLEKLKIKWGIKARKKIRGKDEGNGGF